ncbi:hypothetical protein AX15_007185 [Amanita polypyramis BW_CC]|nr:hypothetical protein AX15_007185 [Amanita polypyramis BW_CC]
MSWITSPTVLRDVAAFSRKDKERMAEEKGGPSSQITVPPPRLDSFNNLVHSATIGLRPEESLCDEYGEQGENQNQDDGPNAWPIKRKRLRYFILVNPYVPLLFRFINITLTSAALGIATHIRQVEIENHLLGIIGSSPLVVIIFAPLTLVHVVVAIYLEYFSRPVGLWRTSAKLAHTLSETAFICAWSAALSLCFDNYFTTLIPCASSSSISWYNQLPRPQSSLPSFEKPLGDQLCHDQAALIGLVLFGLLTYCTNLIISLFRIFEKVKYQSDMTRAP